MSGPTFQSRSNPDFRLIPSCIDDGQLDPTKLLLGQVPNLLTRYTEEGLRGKLTEN